MFETPQATEEAITGLAWSPNGGLLALSATWWTAGMGYIGRVFVVNADGTNLRAVIDGAQPGWMPDGQWLYLVDDDGRLGFAPMNGTCIVTPLDITGIRSPVISPSGDQIAFEHESNIYLLDLDVVLGPNRENLVCPD